MDDVFNTDRPLLFSIAYRMLGSASDAEDVLQDAWLRYSGADRSAIRSPKAFATTIVTRLCLDRLKSARATREEYIGPWLPEPVLTSEVERPGDHAAARRIRDPRVPRAAGKLSPEERAVFLLKDIFEYDHAEIAEMLGMTRRQLAAAAASREGAAGGRTSAAHRHARVAARGGGAIRARVFVGRRRRADRAARG